MAAESVGEVEVEGGGDVEDGLIGTCGVVLGGVGAGFATGSQ